MNKLPQYSVSTMPLKFLGLRLLQKTVNSEPQGPVSVPLHLNRGNNIITSFDKEFLSVFLYKLNSNHLTLRRRDGKDFCKPRTKLPLPIKGAVTKLSQRIISPNKRTEIEKSYQNLWTYSPDLILQDGEYYDIIFWFKRQDVSILWRLYDDIR